LTQNLSQKADISKVQDLVTSIRNELVASLTTHKKDLSAKSKKHAQDIRLDLDKLQDD